jgi:putative FmdB family regulatory protein
MPTYEYECKKCHDRFEVFQSMLAKPLKKCKKCDGGLRRIIGSGAGIIFKGSGFYATDYRSSDYKAKARAETTTCKTCNDSKKCPLDKNKS